MFIGAFREIDLRPDDVKKAERLAVRHATCFLGVDDVIRNAGDLGDPVRRRP
jgi:hypothetical protein